MTDRNIQLRWLVTETCNYDCHYCNQDHSGTGKIVDIIKNPERSFAYLQYAGRNSKHMFDNFPYTTWLKALDIFKDNILTITFTGGEPFLDYKNFAPFLKVLSYQENIKAIRIDTNGAWNPNTYKDVNWKKVFLNHSFHPTQVTLEDFKRSIRKKLEMGINVPMVNYVMAPSQLNDFVKVKKELGQLGIFTNCGVYFGKDAVNDRRIYERFLPKLDIDIKMFSKATKNSLCYYPALAYFISPAGFIGVGCHPNIMGDFIKGEIPELFNDAVKCPADRCFCLDMYCFLKDSGRGQSLNLLEEYVEECKKVERAISNSAIELSTE